MLFEDKPRLLGNEKARSERLKKIKEPHVARLNKFVEKLRKRKNMSREIPYFDPWDGGINAKVLYLLEAPGPKAVCSGFVSRNNPDESAKNMFEISHEAGLDRKHTVTWNIVPWYLGDENGIKPANIKDDIEKGLIELTPLLKILPNIAAIVLTGKKAQNKKVKDFLCNEHPEIKRFDCFHPSPQFVNREPENKEKILQVFKEVKEFIQQNGAH